MGAAQSGDAAAKAKEIAEQGKNKSLEIYKALDGQGAFAHFSEFNVELIRPFKNANFKMEDAVKTAKDEIIATFQLAPTNPQVGFVFYNVLSLYLGCIESLFHVLAGSYISLAWNLGFSYILAYALYFFFLISQKKEYKFYALITATLYMLLNVYLGYKEITSFGLVGLLYFGKAFVNVMMLINGYVIYKEAYGDQLLPK